MEKLHILNRHGGKIVGLLEQPSNPKGLAFVMHGLGGHKEEPVLEAIAESFLSQQITAVRFDTTNSIGESDGNYADATTTNFIEDLEDVITEAKSQSWYSEPFYLAGHSLGGMAVTVYTENHQDTVKGLAPIATVVSGALTTEIRGKKYIEMWKRNGKRVEKDSSIPGLKWNHMEDRLKYNVLPNASSLSMPKLMIVGSEDTHTPLPHQQLLYDKLSCPKEFHVLSNSPHELNTQEATSKVHAIFSEWIKKVERMNSSQ